MPPQAHDACGIDATRFNRLAFAYGHLWPQMSLQATTPLGEVIHAHQVQPASEELLSLRALAISESLRWGEPAIESSPGGQLFWAIPVMHNAVVLGGLIAGITEEQLFGDSGRPLYDLRLALDDLRRLAEEQNLTNAALLANRRADSLLERQKAEAIHAYKSQSGYSLRAAYLLDEPALVSAIRRSQPAEARALINRLLVRIIDHAGSHQELAKCFFLELVVTLSRTAVEAGASPEALLGSNYASMTEVASIRSDEELAHWLHRMLEGILQAMAGVEKTQPTSILSSAREYLKTHGAGEITRDAVADAVGVSPSHFSRVIKAQMGVNFTQWLNQTRIHRAAEDLALSEKPLKIIALEAGYNDQSYFTKVFRRYLKMTPHHYRLQHRSLTQSRPQAL